MTKGTTTAIGAVLLASVVATARTAGAHATYNLSGYGSGLAGSTNGADGSPTTVPASWTSGPSEYAGTLPANWYCGLHNPTQVRTIQTGIAPNPPSGSLLAQVVSYNADADPDLPTDAVLAVGGLSWSDPANSDQGWGHGLDYGLIHVSPLDTILADGPVRLTITVADDPTDGVAPRLAYALYAGWDTGATSTRHQTFTTSPTPVNNPLGSAGLTLVDYAVATAQGQTLSRTYELDVANGGKYTILVGALGGVAGQYQLTAGLFPTGRELSDQLSQCTADLTETTASLTTVTNELAAMTRDADGDGVIDPADACPDTAAGQFVDRAGCSPAQFCGPLAVATKAQRKACQKADWSNDEPLMNGRQADCRYVKASRACEPIP